jgi:ribosomal protein L11 methyltransferase
VIVVVAAESDDALAATHELRIRGATAVHERSIGRGRVLLYGEPFENGPAVDVAASIRALGWPADVRPVDGGHLDAWHNHTRPVIVGGRLWVCFPWSEFDRDQAELVVEIDPGRAFGTGGHPTTRLLLDELESRIKGGESVLDVGCGSGVLAIAAARLGATHVTAIDISALAITATRANAARNHLGKRVQVHDTPVEHLTTRFDAIVANLHAPTLVNLAPAIESLLNPGGWLGLSGLSPAQVSKVAAAYKEVQVVATPTEDDWTAVIATNPK